RGLLAAAQRNQADSSDLGNLLRQSAVGAVLHFRQRQSVGCQRESKNGGVRWVYFAVHGRVWQVLGKICTGSVARRLHLLLRHVNILIEGELQRDDGRAK